MLNLKKWFEENYLDGDEIQDGQMLSSSFCFEALKEQRDEMVEKIVCPFCDNTGEVWNNKKEKKVKCGDGCSYLILKGIR